MANSRTHSKSTHRKVGNINVQETIASVKQHLYQDKIITNALQDDIEDLVEVVDILTKRAVISSLNSSKPPSKDHNGSSIGKNKKRERTGKLSGGQPNHPRTTIEPVVNINGTTI